MASEGSLRPIISASMRAAKGKARDAKRISDIGTIQLALTLYYDRCKQYPATLSLSANNCAVSGVTFANYLAVIPRPPTGAGQTDYDYSSINYLDSSKNYQGYVLHAKLETANEVTKDGLPYGDDAGGIDYSWDCYDSSHKLDYCLSSK
jgi:hypothetical protein